MKAMKAGSTAVYRNGFPDQNILQCFLVVPNSEIVLEKNFRIDLNDPCFFNIVGNQNVTFRRVEVYKNKLCGGGNSNIFCSPKLGEDSHFDVRFAYFAMGVGEFNHQQTTTCFFFGGDNSFPRSEFVLMLCSQILALQVGSEHLMSGAQLWLLWTHGTHHRCFLKLGWAPKMDGENNGKPYDQMDDLGGKPPYFWKHPYIYCIYVYYYYVPEVPVVYCGSTLPHQESGKWFTWRG